MLVIATQMDDFRGFPADFPHEGWRFSSKVLDIYNQMVGYRGCFWCCFYRGVSAAPKKTG